MPFVGRPARTPSAPFRSSTPLPPPTTDKLGKARSESPAPTVIAPGVQSVTQPTMATRSPSPAPTTPIPTMMSSSMPSTMRSPSPAAAGSLIPSAAQVGMYDDPMQGYGYGYGFSNAGTAHGYGYGYAQSAAPSHFGGDALSPAAYYGAGIPQDPMQALAALFAQQQQQYNQTMSMMMGWGNTMQQQHPSYGSTYQFPDQFGASTVTAPSPATMPTVAPSMQARSASSTVAQRTNAWWRTQQQQQSAIKTPWGTTIPAAQPNLGPTAEAARQREWYTTQHVPSTWTKGSSTGWSNTSVVDMVKTGVQTGVRMLQGKAKERLVEAFQPRVSTLPVMLEWDSSRPRSYAYDPTARVVVENGMPVGEVQYLVDGCFNFTVNGVRMGATMKTTTPSTTLRMMGGMRGDDWMFVDRNRQTRYRAARKQRNFYDLQVVLGGNQHLGRLVWVCRWYEALISGRLSVLDEMGNVIANCTLEGDATSGRNISINCAAGPDHVALIFTILMSLELARQYGNDLMRPTNRKGTMGFGPTVLPELFMA